jgi:hypothetical protein
MGKSLYEIHVGIVSELRKAGETEIYNPTKKSFLRDSCDPDVYVKGRAFPSEDFISGSAFREDDGSITIFQDHLAYCRPGFVIDQLGLCDPVLWYENGNLLKVVPQKKICPLCGAITAAE